MDLHRYYTGKNILITGCTGFVGKVLLEKVLRSLPETGQIYLLVREKRDMTVEQRCDQIFESYLFTQLKKRFPDNQSFKTYIQQKIVLVNGNMVKDRLAMSAEDRKRVTDNVNIIINSAASVRFDD